MHHTDEPGCFISSVGEIIAPYLAEEVRSVDF
jgi:hypothetical protein